MAQCSTYLPGFSESLNALERFVGYKVRDEFNKSQTHTIRRLSKKNMGPRNGTNPIEQHYSLTSVDAGVIQTIETGTKQNVTDIQQGLDCTGQIMDMVTKGGQAHDPLCGGSFRGSYAVGVDSFGPDFYTYETRFPTFCVDAATTSPEEVKKTLRAIHQMGPNRVVQDLDYLMQDLVLARGVGNTSIARRVEFSRDRGLDAGQFPFDAQGVYAHEFGKEIKRIAMMEPSNYGKMFTIEGPELDIQNAINKHQDALGIQRYTLGAIQDPFRGERGVMYDGIKYIFMDHPEYIGVRPVDPTNPGPPSDQPTCFERPRHHVHVPGNEYGLVARGNTELGRGCKIRCGDNELDKRVLFHWYIGHDAVSYVPFIAKNDFPTSGDEKIKDNVYSSPTAFKPFWVAPHAVETPGNCSNDRNQYQQMGMRTVFGLFNRTDILNYGSILALPFFEDIPLLTSPCPEDDPNPATAELEPCDRGEALSNGCEPCEGSSGTQPAGSGAGIDGAVIVAARIEGPTPGDVNTVGTEDDTTLVLNIFNGTENLDAVTLEVEAIDGSAVNGTEYTFAPTTVTLPAGDDTAQTISITIPDLPDGYTGDFMITVTSTDVGSENDIDPITVVINDPGVTNA